MDGKSTQGLEVRPRKDKMKKLWISIVASSVAIAVSAEVSVTNLVVAQRPGTKLVDITYDVSSATMNAVTISLTVSNGAVKVITTNLTGAVGSGITNGTGKSIVWNMGTDWDGNVADLSFTVQADDRIAVCVVAKTGQTTLYRAGDDGHLEPGVAWPSPRFVVVTNGTDQTVLDNLTGLEWVQVPHALSGNSGTPVWNSAIDFCNNLVYAGHSDWRLPSCKELMSLVDYRRYSPALPGGHPFTGVQYNYYWSGTSGANGSLAWGVNMDSGSAASIDKTYHGLCWPVRGGQ
jgi:hypothetical protein